MKKMIRLFIVTMTLTLQNFAYAGPTEDVSAAQAWLSTMALPDGMTILSNELSKDPISGELQWMGEVKKEDQRLSFRIWSAGDRNARLEVSREGTGIIQTLSIRSARRNTEVSESFPFSRTVKEVVEIHMRVNTSTNVMVGLSISSAKKNDRWFSRWKTEKISVGSLHSDTCKVAIREL